MSLEPVSRIADNLWIGAAPPSGDLPEMDVLVLAAEELPQSEVQVRGPRILEASLPDDELTDEQKSRAIAVAAEVAKALSGGQKVLSTCAMGINRSSLIAALALVMLGVPAAGAIGLIREQRHHRALNNEHFVELIYQTYVDILDKEIEGLVDAINQMLASRDVESRSRTSSSRALVQARSAPRT